MGCGCRKNRPAGDSRSTTGTTYYEVWRNGSFTGRRYTSLPSAESYAQKIGGEVRTS